MPAEMSLPPAQTETFTSARHPLALFFDGECCFCNRWVGGIMRADQSHRIRFGAKQGETFQRILRVRPEAANLDSVVLLVRQPDGGETVLAQSAAILAVMEGLKGYEFFTAVLRLTPRPLADLGYGIFSKSRKTIFGSQNICKVVKPEERELFLD